MIIFDYAEIRKYLKEPYPFESTNVVKSKPKPPITVPTVATQEYLCNRKYGNNITCPVVCMKHTHEKSPQVCSNFGGLNK